MVKIDFILYLVLLSLVFVLGYRFFANKNSIVPPQPTIEINSFYYNGEYIGQEITDNKKSKVIDRNGETISYVYRGRIVDVGDYLIRHHLEKQHSEILKTELPK